MKRINKNAKLIVRKCLYKKNSDGVPESETRKYARTLECYLTEKELQYLADATDANELFYEEMRRWDKLKIVRDLMNEWKKNN